MECVLIAAGDGIFRVEGGEDRDKAPPQDPRLSEAKPVGIDLVTQGVEKMNHNG